MESLFVGRFCSSSSASSSSQTRSRFVRRSAGKGSSADGGGVGSPCGSCRGWEARADATRHFSEIDMPSALSSSSSLSLDSSEVTSQRSSSAFNSAQRFSFTSGWRTPDGPVIGGLAIHGPSAYLHYVDGSEHPRERGDKFLIVRGLEDWCAPARNKVGAASANDVEVVLQYSRYGQLTGCTM